ncbi:hypothetical protein ACP70R_048124 [Stipagrostis hirtigluma subsp. patula]
MPDHLQEIILELFKKPCVDETIGTMVDQFKKPCVSLASLLLLSVLVTGVRAVRDPAHGGKEVGANETHTLESRRRDDVDATRNSGECHCHSNGHGHSHGHGHGVSGKGHGTPRTPAVPNSWIITAAAPATVEWRLAAATRVILVGATINWLFHL